MSRALLGSRIIVPTLSSSLCLGSKKNPLESFLGCGVYNKFSVLGVSFKDLGIVPRGGFGVVLLPIRAMALSTLSDVADGEFKRKEATFRNFISSQPGAEFPPENGRYHLYISYACPWASRCYAFMKLKGLEDAIGLTVCFFSLECVVVLCLWQLGFCGVYLFYFTFLVRDFPTITKPAISKQTFLRILILLSNP